MKNVNKCDKYGFKFYGIVTSKCTNKNQFVLTAIYKNFFTFEESQFTISLDHKGLIKDTLKIKNIKAFLEQNNIADGFMYLLSIKSEKDSIESLIGELPESIVLNHKDIVNSIISKYNSQDIKSAINSRRKILLDAITQKV